MKDIIHWEIPDSISMDEMSGLVTEKHFSKNNDHSNI